MNLNATLIIEVLSFLLLVFILLKLLYKPLLSLMDKRQSQVKDMVEGAKQAEEKAKSYADETHKALDMAKEQALRIKEETRKLSDAERRRIIEEAKKEAHFLIEDAKNRLTQERESVLKKLRSDIATISVDIAKRILSREIKEEDHKRLIEESISEIENELSRS